MNADYTGSSLSIFLWIISVWIFFLSFYLLFFLKIFFNRHFNINFDIWMLFKIFLKTFYSVSFSFLICWMNSHMPGRMRHLSCIQRAFVASPHDTLLFKLNAFLAVCFSRCFFFHIHSSFSYKNIMYSIKSNLFLMRAYKSLRRWLMGREKVLRARWYCDLKSRVKIV